MKNLKTENAIKRLEHAQKNASPELREELKEKINTLKSGKTVSK